MSAGARKPVLAVSLRSLTGRFALWSVLSTIVSLMVFALTVFVVVVVAQQSEPSLLTQEEINLEAGQDVLVAMAIALPFGLLFAVGGSLWLSKRTLAPITDVIHSAQEMSAHDLERRLTVPAADDELRALVVAQNSLFERLEQGFSALSQFAANASHEIRTPLAVIENELEVALRRPRTPEEWRGAATRSLDELRRLNRLIQALLDFARADASPATPSSVGVRVVVSELVARFGAEAEARGIVLTVPEENGGEVWVAASDEALSIALSNLLSNAIRYTSDRGTVSVTIEKRGVDRAAIHVDDSGPGIDATERQEIFAPFARGKEGVLADRRDGDGRRGLGLGLSITKRIIERHRGALSVAASASGGARFSVELPIA